MRKFAGLIVNEYIKILCKTSTKIMLVTIMVVALGYNLLLYIASNESSNHRYYGWGADEYIANAQSEKYDGWERDVELYTYFRDNSIDIVNYPNSDNSQVWRTGAVYTLFNMKDLLKTSETRGNAADLIESIKTYIETADTAIKNSDWMKFYEVELSRYKINFTDSAILGIETDGLKYKIDNNISPNDWRSNVVDMLTRNKISLLNYDANTLDSAIEEEIMGLKNSIAVAEYRLEHGVEFYIYDGIESTNDVDAESAHFWKIFAVSVMTISIISVLIIVVSGSLLSSEFSAGTVKFLLINPVKRWKIFTDKYVSVLTMTFAALFVLYVFNAIFAGIFFGFGNLNAPYLSASEGKILVGSGFGYVASKYLLGSVGMICMATFAFAISSLVRNSSLSIGLGVFLFLIGNSAVQILNYGFGLYQSKYILFANTDINSVINGTTGFVNHTLTFALVNIAVYMGVFLLTAWDAFVRSDVK